VRVECRKEYTDACQEKGADREGIREGTNAIYRHTGRPAGDRDTWPEEQQKVIAVTEHFAAGRVKSLPDPQGTQDEANDAVVEASGEGARVAKEYIADKEDNSNWWGRLFGS